MQNSWGTRGSWPAWPRGGSRLARSMAALWTGGGRGGPPVHGGPGGGAGRRGPGPWWTWSCGDRAAVHGGPRAGAGRAQAHAAGQAGPRRRAMAGRGELSAAALQCTESRAKGTGGRGSTRQARWRAYLRETTTAKRSSTAAALGVFRRRRESRRNRARVSRGSEWRLGLLGTRAGELRRYL